MKDNIDILMRDFPFIFQSDSDQNLCYAIGNNNLQAVIDAVEDPHYPANVNARPRPMPFTILSIACRYNNNSDIVKYLIEKRAELYPRNISQSCYPMLQALQFGNLKIVKTLINCGYDPMIHKNAYKNNRSFLSYSNLKSLSEGLSDFIWDCYIANNSLKAFFPSDITNTILHFVPEYPEHKYIPRFKLLLNEFKHQKSIKEKTAYKIVFPPIIGCCAIILPFIIDMDFIITSALVLSASAAMAYAYNQHKKKHEDIRHQEDNFVQDLRICMDVKTLIQHTSEFINSTRDRVSTTLSSYGL